MLEAFWASSCKGLWYRSYLCKRRGRGTDGPRKQARAAGRGDRLPKEHVGDRPRDADPPTTLLPKSRCAPRERPLWCGGVGGSVPSTVRLEERHVCLAPPRVPPTSLLPARSPSSLALCVNLCSNSSHLPVPPGRSPVRIRHCPCVRSAACAPGSVCRPLLLGWRAG